MKVMKSRVEFLQRVYPLIASTDAIVTTVQAWVNNNEMIARYGDLLSKSPLAQQIVADLKFMLWDMAYTWDCEYDGQISSTQGYEDIEKHFESLDGATGDPRREPISYAMDLKTLEQVAQIATEALKDIFERYFFEMPSDSNHIIVPHAVVRTLDKLQRDLPDKLFWLEQILTDVEYVIESNKGQDWKKVSKKPKNSPHTIQVR